MLPPDALPHLPYVYMRFCVHCSCSILLPKEVPEERRQTLLCERCEATPAIVEAMKRRKRRLALESLR